MHRERDKPPRQWAEEIASLRSVEERRERLETVPQDLRPLVERHLLNAWQIRRFRQGR
jgi:hypothetical protein